MAGSRPAARGGERSYSPDTLRRLALVVSRARPRPPNRSPETESRAAIEHGWPAGLMHSRSARRLAALSLCDVGMRARRADSHVGIREPCRRLVVRESCDRTSASGRRRRRSRGCLCPRPAARCWPGDVDVVTASVGERQWVYGERVIEIVAKRKPASTFSGEESHRQLSGRCERADRAVVAFSLAPIPYIARLVGAVTSPTTGLSAPAGRDR
jgi:hypothetical protein